MINWNILGITPTSDKSAIKKAYRSRLAETNPEDKPEEFMALREAYEAAMEYARNLPEEESEEETDGQQRPPIQLLPADHPAYSWTKKLDALYWDFYRRIDTSAWEELCADPLCTRIDTAADVRDALLHFLMEYWFIPDRAVCILDQTFGFEEHKASLLEQYPREFVDAILLAPLHRKSGSIDYTLFQGAPDADYDGYIRSYYTLTGLVNSHQFQEAWDMVNRMEDTGIIHPFLQVEKTKLYLGEDKLDLAAATISTVYPDYAHSGTVCCMAGETALAEEDFHRALDCFTAALEIPEDSIWAEIGLAEANLELRNYEEAQKWIDKVLEEDRYSPRALSLEEAIQEARKEGLLQRLSDGEASASDRLTLSTIYIDAGEFPLAIDLLSGFHAAEKKEEAQRLHYLATAHLSMENSEEARHEFRMAGELLRELREVTADPEEQKKHIMNLARTGVMESVALEQLNQLEEALQLVTNITLDSPQLAMPFCRKAELHYELKQYEEAIDAATQSLELDDTFHLPYRIRANAYYELGYYNDAFQDCCDCLDIYPGEIEAYFCKINILIEVGETDIAVQELDDLESQVKGTQITFLRGKAQEASGNLEQAYAVYHQVMDDHEDSKREVFPPAEVHSLAGTIYRLVQVCRELYHRTQKSTYWKEYMQLLQDGVKKFPADLELLSDLAGEYYGISRHQDAQKLYERLAELDPDGFRYAQIAGNEIQMDRFDAALHHLQTAETMDPELIYSQILYAAVHTHCNRYEPALKYINRALQLADEQEKNWPRILRDKAMIYSRMKEYDLAINTYRESWNRYQEAEDICSLMEMYRISGRFVEALAEGKTFLASHSAEECPDILDEMKQAATSLGDWEQTEYWCARDPRPFFRNFYAGRHLMFSDVLGPDTAREALKYFLQAHEADPSALHNLLEIARLYLKLKDKKNAYLFAGKVLEAVPSDYMDSGYQRAYYLARSAEALAILGKYKEAEARIRMAMEGRKCEFCRYGGCLDAYCAMVYLCCLQGDEEGAAKYQRMGLEISPHDMDLLHLPEYFFVKKRGLFR